MDSFEAFARQNGLPPLGQDENPYVLYPEYRHYTLPEERNSVNHETAISSGAPSNAATTSSPITKSPTLPPSFTPSGSPTVSRVTLHTDSPSFEPSANASEFVSSSPSQYPSLKPSIVPSESPTDIITKVPTASPSDIFTENPTAPPTELISPTFIPSTETTTSPTEGEEVIKSKTTYTPSFSPSDDIVHSDTPTIDPSIGSSYPPSLSPSDDIVRTDTPTIDPSIGSSYPPSFSPSDVIGHSNTPTTDSNVSTSPTVSPTISRSSTVQATATPTNAIDITSSPSNANNLSNLPSNEITGSPTYVATDSSTKNPTSTAVNTNETSLSPTISTVFSPIATPACVSNDSGVFGNFGGSSVSNSVEYFYNMEIDQTLNTDVETEILPILEKAIVDKILPFFFLNECGSGERRSLEVSGSIRRGNRRLATTGVSSQPPDLIYEEASCTPANIGNDCSTIMGRMTFYTDSAETSELDSVSDRICDLMGDGTLKRAHPAIAGLQCTNISNSVVIPPINRDSNPIQPVSGRIEAYNYVLGALAAVFIVMGMYVYRRRHALEDDSTNSNNLDDSDDVNISSSTYCDGSGPPAMDLRPIHGVSTLSSPRGIGTYAKHSYVPETIEESMDEDASLDGSSQGERMTYTDESSLLY